MNNGGSSFRLRLAVCAGLALITLAIYSPVLTHGFLIYDDQQYVTTNPQVRAGLRWHGIVWAFTTFYASNWHPLTWISHMLDCQLYGLNPLGHHLTNLLLHTANTALLFLFLNRATGALWRSALVAGLFAWHPLHVESVAWIAERKDVLSAFFFLLTIGAYVRYAEKSVISDQWSVVWKKGRAAWYCGALAFFALGLLSKPMLVTVPFVLLLLDYWPLMRGARAEARMVKLIGALLLEKVPFFVLAGLVCVLTVLAQGRAYSIVSNAALPLSTRMGHAAISYAHYVGATFGPRRLAAYYPYESKEPVSEIMLACGFLVLITVMAVWFAKRRPYLLVGWLWFLGMLVPVIGLVQVGDQAWADRYTYLPLIGIFMAVVWEGAQLLDEKIANPKARGRFAAVASAAVALPLLGMTWHQVGYWKSSRSLFEHAAAVTENNAKAITLLGSLLAEEGKLDEARSYYARALAYDSRNPQAHYSLGKLLEREGKLNEAITEYEHALWFKPLREETHIRIGMLLAKQNRSSEAAAQYQAALDFNPQSAAALNNLARLLHTEGRSDEAIEKYSSALKIDPGLAEAHNNLGVLLLQKGKISEGVAQLREALRLKRSDPETEYNLAMGLNQQSQWNEAALLFARIAPARPQDANLYCEYGLALSNLGRTREAMRCYAHALLIQPDLPAALDRLAWILVTDPDPSIRNGAEALPMAQRAYELTGMKDAEKLLTLAAAYAENGRFAEAAETVKKTEQLPKMNQPFNSMAQRMLEAFRSEKPWREEKERYANPSASSNPR